MIGAQTSLHMAVRYAETGDVSIGLIVALAAALGIDANEVSTRTALGRMIPGLAHVVTERLRQIKKGYDAEHDATEHPGGEIAVAAAMMLLPSGIASEPLLSGDLGVESPTVIDVIGASTFHVERQCQIDCPEEFSQDAVDDRVRDICVGLALGLAEVERFLGVELDK